MNRYLNEKALQESIGGGPAYYRQAHLRPSSFAPNTLALHLAQMKQDREPAEKKYRLLRLKLPGRSHKEIRLPRWALLGKLSA